MRNLLFLNWIILAVIIISLTSLVPAEVAGCKFPSEFPHGKLIYENQADGKLLDEAPENYTLQFRCNKGYQLVGSQTLFCAQRGWTGAFPRCFQIYCGNPPPIPKGIFKVTTGVNKRTVIGATVKYSCLKGFELVDETVNSLTCKLNGTLAIWVGELPRCKDTNICPDPGVSPSGRREGNCCFKGDVLKFTCDDGYQIVGRQEIECLEGGTWSAPRARCRPPGIVCPDPPDLTNGIIKSNKAGDFFLPLDEVMIICNEGYSVRNGSDQLFCEDDGLWEEVFGSCEEIICMYPEIPANGSIPELKDSNLNTFPYGFDLTYKCDEGFRIRGISWNTCNERRWVFQTPKCEVLKCHDPGVPENGWRQGNNFDIGSKVSFSCLTGYALLGSAERYCLNNGQWSGELTICNSNGTRCPHPGIPINAMKTGNAYDEGDTVSYKCSSGFFLRGSPTRVCQRNGSWTGVQPKCLDPYDLDNRVDVLDRPKLIVQDKVEFQQQELEIQNGSLPKPTTQTNFSSTEKPEISLMRTSLYRNLPGSIILYFIFDTSRSIGQENFRLSIEFAKALVRKVRITPNGARAGAITFSYDAIVQFMPVELTTTEEVIKALNDMEYRTGGGTAVNAALDRLFTDVMPITKALLGSKTKSIIFLLTDGKYNVGGDPRLKAKELKEGGAEIYCIGISGSLRKGNLYDIASEPHEEYVFILNDYSTMSYLIQEVVNGTIDYSECGLGLEKVSGRYEIDMRSRILGGRKAVEPWPWMAALFLVDPARGPGSAKLMCGGSVIGREWILTSAHCLVDKANGDKVRDTNTVIVKLGLTNVKNETNLLEFEPEEFIIHDKYDPKTFDYDIALIKVGRTIDFNAYIRPICLPPEELPDDTSLYKFGENAFAIGWGYDKKKGASVVVRQKTVEHLKELRLPIQSEDRCRSSLEDTYFIFTDQMFCAGSGTGEAGTCAGDGGGPFMQSQLNEEGNIYWVQTGIISWGIGCGQINTYEFYTHVQRLRNWISENMNVN